MERSLPCPNCGRVDDLENVKPLGILMDRAVLWNCRSGNTRAVDIDYHTPMGLVIKAIAVMDGMRDRTNNHHPYREGGNAPS